MMSLFLKTKPLETREGVGSAGRKDIRAPGPDGLKKMWWLAERYY